jgi:hypothetical protein
MSDAQSVADAVGAGMYARDRAAQDRGDRLDRGVGRVVREVVKGGDPVLRVVHPSVRLRGQPGKTPGYRAGLPGVRPARERPPTANTTTTNPPASPWNTRV